MSKPLYRGKWRSESAWQSHRAGVLRQQILDEIGHECMECGTAYEVEINHVYQRDWKPRKLSMYRRTLRYMRELRAGVPLTPLCKEHNGAYRPKPWPVGEARMEEPF